MIQCYVQRSNNQSEVPEEGTPAAGLPDSGFIADHVQLQPPIVQTTITRDENPMRKREVIAPGKLRAATEQRVIVDKMK